LILRHLELIDTDFTIFLVATLAGVFALITGIAFHEACHAFTATSLGDSLPRRQGRTTLNPLAHLDPFGTFLMLFVGFGWGKPVQFNPFGLKMSPKMASFFVALAGPMSNFVVAGVLAIPIQLDIVPYVNPNLRSLLLPFFVDSREEYVGMFLSTALYLNVILGVFNLIPIPPLDGFKVALGILPDDLAAEFAKLDQYGFMILIGVLFIIPLMTGWNPVWDLMFPTVENVVEFLIGAQ
jgi:Zn-dependent protease